MRVVFVNHCHPDTPHVCATRIREFAAALSVLGHEVILLTEVLEGQPSVTPAIGSHDFSTPLYLATTPTGHPYISALRKRTLPWGLRQAVVIWHYLKYKGVFTDWRSGTQAILPTIAEQFKPDLVWASFGNTDCWNIAKDLAHLSGCPWIADLKDLWSNFIPRPLQKHLSHHFNDCAAITTFSNFHSKDAEAFFDAVATPIYSGFSKNALMPNSSGEATKTTISLTGAIYDETALIKLIEGIEIWHTTKDAELQFVYAGHDMAEVETATAELSKRCKVDIKGYLPLEELREIQRNATANLYIKNDRTFHHKTIEMLSVGRPIICFPGETGEAIEIAHTTGVPLHSCSSPDEIATALEQSLNFTTIDVKKSTGILGLTWQAQAKKLEHVFQDVLDQTGEKSHV
jgi:hypothetical protein